MPAGLWMCCDVCRALLYRELVERNLGVCPECQHPFPISARRRIEQLLDEGTFEEWCGDLLSADPIPFTAPTSNAETFHVEPRSLGPEEAALTGSGRIGGRPIILVAIETGFLRGGMGSVVGEKLARAAEEGSRRRLPLIVVSGAGAAEAPYQEGPFALLQLAKVGAALARFRRDGGLLISVLTGQTLGEEAPSFGSPGDFTIAESTATDVPNDPAASSRTSRDLSESRRDVRSLLAHGLVDIVIPRKDLRKTIYLLIDYTAESCLR